MHGHPSSWPRRGMIITLPWALPLYVIYQTIVDPGSLASS